MKEKFRGKLGEYQVVMTEDGSPTLYGSHFDENCHSLSGASGETIYNFIEKTELLEKIKELKEINILEIGFGTGMGFLATYDAIRKVDSEIILSFISLEIDEDLPQIAKELWHQYPVFSMESLQIIQNLQRDHNFYEFKNHNTRLKILLGDAREKIQTLGAEEVHIIYQDAFSPKRIQHFGKSLGLMSSFESKAWCCDDDL